VLETRLLCPHQVVLKDVNNLSLGTVIFFLQI
jgi:hypothetical protein